PTLASTTATASAASVAKISRTNGRASCFGFAFLRGRLDWRATARLLSPSAAGPFARGVDFRPETPARITVIQKRPPRAVRHAAATAGGPPKGSRYNPGRRCAMDERCESSREEHCAWNDVDRE